MNIELDLWQYALLCSVGTFAGFINVMAGGGSLLTLPLMVFLGLPGPVANGTNRVAITIQNISAVIGFKAKGYANFKLSLSLALCTLPGAVLGALAATRLEGVWFNRVLAGVMIMVLLLMLSKKRKPKGSPEAPTESSSIRHVPLGHLLMVGVGFYGGFIQAGVGFILMAVLHRVMGMDLIRVNMHKVFIVLVFTLTAMITFALKGQIFWAAGLVLAVGNATGAWIATHFAVKKGEKAIRVILYVAISVMALRLLMIAK